MALDRFIYFQIVPDFTTITEDVSAFINGFGGDVKSAGGRLIVTIPGEPEVDRGLLGRWFEVYIGDNYIDVITRQQDEFVNGLAATYANRLARKFDGTLDQ